MNIQNNQTQSTYKIYGSGLYMEPFFTKVKNLMDKIHDNNEFDLIEYNYDLLKKDYIDNSADESINFSEDDESYSQELNEYFWEKLSYWPTYFKPLKFNEEIAYQCDLIPFVYRGYEKDIKLLALGGCGMDLSPRLDAYQALTDRTIDPYSKLFYERNYFEYVMGKYLTDEILKIVSKK